MKKNDTIEMVKRYLGTPRDIAGNTIEDQAAILTLHFIGYVAKPIGITEEVYKKCVKAFNGNRGKFEEESKAVLTVLKEVKDGR